MATISPPISPRTGSRRWRRAGFFLIAFALAVAGAAAWLYSVAHSALPQLDGTLKVPGLAAQVKVTRDQHGVPTIEAANFDDLFLAQGYVTAQDRLWQMDGMRRFAAGQLSETLGDDFLKHDRQQRILGLQAVARKQVEAAAAEDRARFQAYARGVNAYMESHRERLPLEFRLLNFLEALHLHHGHGRQTTIRPWTPEDSALVAAQMVQNLSTSPRYALAREKLLAKLGPELTADLYVNSSWHDRPPTVPRPSLQDHQSDRDYDDDQDMDSGPPGSVARQRHQSLPHADAPADMQLVAHPEVVEGSNNWVVSGEHTVTGKPLLSNDMHLGHQMPNLWYEAHLHCGNFDVAGVTLPGLPYVVVGHNQRIAWGFTNIGPAVEDAYLETFNEKGEYLTPEGWKQPEHRREVIRVKDKPDVMVDVVLTRHGPIVTDLWPGETRKIALRWTLYDGASNPLFAVDSAQNWQQFRNAFSRFDAPAQNVVYGDVDGNIGYQATGKVPIRASGDGSLPENGSDNAHEWTGYIPFDKLPSVFNPPSGIIATANSRITPDGYAYSISTDWDAPWRSARIYRVLESGRKFSAADMLALQTDIYSELDRYSAERFVYAVDRGRNPSTRAKQAAEIMRAWDGRMSADSTAPILVTRARTELARLLLEPKLGPAPKNPGPSEAGLSWETYRWGMQSVWLENILLHQPKRWLPDAYPNYDELLAAAVEACISDPEAPKDLNLWKWGPYHPVEIQHPILGQIPVLRLWTGPGVQPQSGSGFTVKAVTRSHGPSERMTVDLSDLDQSTLNVVTGQAGNFLSPYYMDQWRAWYEGFTFKLPFSKEAVASSRQHELVLEP